jgi:hypothetical protein
MAFLPVDLPIQEILLTNFITDIATISNANSLLLKDKLEDLINNFEIDTTTISIGTDNPINYIRTQSVVLEGTGFTFQTGTPTQIIAKLEKNLLSKSVFTVDQIIANQSVSTDALTINTISVASDVTVNATATATVNSPITFNSSVIESKETVIVDFTKNGNDAEGFLTLSSTSRQNIFVKIRTTTAPTLNPVYNGGGAFNAINLFALYIDFDATNPPLENTVFRIHLVDIVETNGNSIINFVGTATIPIVFRAGTNQNTTNSIILQTGLGSLTYDVGINPNSANVTVSDQQLKSLVPAKYGHSLSLLYIIDENLDDRLMINGMVGMEFIP